MSTLCPVECLDVNDGSKLDEWLERFDLYCITNKAITDKTRVAHFLTIAGREAYSVLRNILHPIKPAETDYEKLKQALINHCRPPCFIATERAKFHTMARKTDEDIRSFTFQLQKQASKCAFETALNSQLLDRLIAGINKPDLQRRLLLSENLTYVKAKDMCVKYFDTEAAVQAPATENCVLAMHRKNSQIRQKQNNTKSSNYAKREYSNSSTTKIQGSCQSCGGSHLRQTCKFRSAQCHSCKKLGHIKRVCNSVKLIQEVIDSHESLAVLSVQQDRHSSHVTEVLQFESGQKYKFIVDTGSPITFFPISMLRKLAPGAVVKQTSVRIVGVTGHSLPVVGECILMVTNQSQATDIRFVLTTKGFAVLGLDGIKALSLVVKVFTTTHQSTNEDRNRQLNPTLSTISQLIHTCSTLRGGIKMPGVQLSMVSTNPVFCKRRVIPFGQRDVVKKLLENHVESGIISPVETSQWATPVVIAIKSDGTPRICGDYRVTVNPHLLHRSTITPTLEDMFVCLEDQRWFSRIDLKNAFLQIPVADESKPLTTITTPWGLYQYNYLPFGLSVSPGIFQETINTIIKDLMGVRAYQDDLLVFGKDTEEHDRNLLALLNRFKEKNVFINGKKSEFRVNKLQYLGYLLQGGKILPDPDRLKPMINAASRDSFKALRSVMGCLQYYSRFIPQFTTLASPLYDLQSTDEWAWSAEHEEALKRIKLLISQEASLRLYVPGKPTTLVTDASEYGIGGVLEQNGFPVLCVSRRLSKAECNYSQTQKEALAIVWSVKRLHKFLFGFKFTIVTDHQALQHIFAPDSTLSKSTSAMLQRWALTLSGYSYNIVYRPGKQVPQADCLSRVFITNSTDIDSSTALLIHPLPVQRNKLIEETRKSFGAVLRSLKFGWSAAAKKRFPELYARRDELSTSPDGVLLTKEQVIVPVTLRGDILSHLHSGHLGVDKMRSLARMLCWWPSINADISKTAKECSKCKHKPITHPHLSPWPLAYRPWQRIHADYCGPFLKKYYALIVIDSYSKWPEIFWTSSASSQFTQTALRRCFSREGIPQVLVTDNGTPFTSENTRNWLKSIGCHQVFTAPRHPQSNGLAENFVKTLKSAIQSAQVKTLSELEKCCDHFLLQYRNAVHSTSRDSPAHLFKGRPLRSQLHSLDTATISFNRGNNLRPTRGIVLRAVGSSMLEVMDLEDATVHRRHADQVKFEATQEEEKLL